MGIINNINNKAEQIINKTTQYNLYKEELERKAEQNHLYKIDREDKKTFKENNEELENEKIELENMIREYLTSIKII